MSLEDTLSAWTNPSSSTEQEKQERTERMIREAVSEHGAFKSCALNVFAKGSYANNTNVRADSDVDIAVECSNAFYWEEAQPGSFRNTNPYTGEWTPQRLRQELGAALEAKFPGQVDKSGAVAFQINSNTARVDADVVPCFSYRYYFADGTYCAGNKIFTTGGTAIVNYPVQQLENGRAKNTRTGYAFKKGVRILKRLENAMAADGGFRDLPSYFMECLSYNCPDSVFHATTWTSVLQQMLHHISTSLEGDEPPQRRWMEVNNCFYLFHPHQKWTRADGRGFAQAASKYLGW